MSRPFSRVPFPGLMFIARSYGSKASGNSGNIVAVFPEVKKFGIAKASFENSPIDESSLRKAVWQHSTIQYVTLPRRFCNSVYELAMGLTDKKFKFSEPNSQEIIRREIGFLIDREDDLQEAREEFNKGKITTLVFDGDIATLDQQHAANVEMAYSHIRKKGDEPSSQRLKEKGLLAAVHSPAFMFGLALAPNYELIPERNVANFNIISSIESQRLHTDFERYQGQIEGQVVFFTGFVDNPSPPLQTVSVPTPLLLGFLSEEELNFLSQPQFFVSYYTNGEDRLTAPFAIVNAQSMIWDGKWAFEKSIHTQNPADKEKAYAIFDKIDRISALLFHHNLLPTVNLKSGTHMLIWNHREGKPHTLHGRLHDHTSGYGLGEGGVLTHLPKDPDLLFGGKNTAYVEKDSDKKPREIGRMPLQERKDKKVEEPKSDKLKIQTRNEAPLQKPSPKAKAPSASTAKDAENSKGGSKYIL